MHISRPYSRCVSSATTVAMSIENMTREELVERFTALQKKLNHDLAHPEASVFMSESEWNEFKSLYSRCKQFGLAKQEVKQAAADRAIVDGMIVRLEDLQEALARRQAQLTHEQLCELKALATRFEGEDEGLMRQIDAEMAKFKKGTEQVSKRG